MWDILDKIDKLDVHKSAGPDDILPRCVTYHYEATACTEQEDYKGDLSVERDLARIMGITRAMSLTHR